MGCAGSSEAAAKYSADNDKPASVPEPAPVKQEAIPPATSQSPLKANGSTVAIAAAEPVPDEKPVAQPAAKTSSHDNDTMVKV